MTDLKGNIFFNGPAGRIEAILKEPADAVTGAAVVCHPHPQFGGTMHNKVVFRIARAFQERGYAVLRFNFRGTGGSEGEYDDARGEQDDLRAAIKFIVERYKGARLWVAGFSFGAAVVLRASCSDSRVYAIIAVGVPVSKYDFNEVTLCGKPKLFVQGEHDEFGPIPDLQRFVERLPEPKHLRVIEGAGHFFDNHLHEVSGAVSEFCRVYEQE
jgi:hypothetical protein